MTCLVWNVGQYVYFHCYRTINILKNYSVWYRIIEIYICMIFPTCKPCIHNLILLLYRTDGICEYMSHVFISHTYGYSTVLQLSESCQFISCHIYNNIIANLFILFCDENASGAFNVSLAHLSKTCHRFMLSIKMPPRCLVRFILVIQIGHEYLKLYSNKPNT